MKPRVLLEESTHPAGGVVTLHEHDGRLQLALDGTALAGPQTRAGEQALAETGLAPFRPVRQPVIWLAGLGLGTLLDAAIAALPQKKGHFIVAEPHLELRDWIRRHQPLACLDDDRVSFEDSAAASSLQRHVDGLHAILIHADTAPPHPGGIPAVIDPRWLAAAHNALKDGGLIALTSLAPIRGIESQLRRQGFDTAIYEIPSSPHARRPRMLPLYLARKGKFSSQNR